MDALGFNFIDYVLGFDPTQKQTLMMGFMYHSYYLDVVAGKTMSQAGLRDVVMAFGLIGFTTLALNRAWWKPSILLSWLVVTLIVMLGGRGEVLTLSVDGKIVQPTAAQALLSSPSMQVPIRFFDNIYNNMADLLGGQQNTGDLQVDFGNGLTATWPRAADGLQQAKVYDAAAPIKGYTPAVLALYAMNRLKTVLLLSLPFPNQGDIVAMRATANRMLAAEPRLPTTMYLTDMFGVACATDNNPYIKDYINNKGGFFHPETDMAKPELKNFKDALENSKFTVNDVERINNIVFPTLKSNVQKNSWPVAGIVDSVTISAIPQYLTSTRYVSNVPITSGNTNVDRQTTPADMATWRITTAKEQFNRGDLTFVEPLPSKVLQAPAQIVYYGLKPTENGEAGAEPQTVIFSSCYDMYGLVRNSYAAEVLPTNIEKEAGDLAFNEMQTGDGNARRLDGTNASAATLASMALRGQSKQKDSVCNNQGFFSGWLSHSCDDEKAKYQAFENAFKDNAIRSRLALLGASQKMAYEPGKLFTGDVRKWTSKLGDMLAPIALWFTALFGGFATGTYAAIIPTFISFVMAMVIAVTPLLFVVGLLVPSFCPGILMTPVLVILYLKTVEVMFVVVTSIFSMIRDGIIATQSYSPADGMSEQTLVTSIYDISVGLTYTSMFVLAGYIFNMGSPEKMLGKLGGMDGIGKIDAKEAFQMGGATALASRALNMAGKGVDAVKPGGTISGMLAKGSAVLETGQLFSKAGYGQGFAEQKEGEVQARANKEKRRGVLDSLNPANQNPDRTFTAEDRVKLAYKEGKDEGGKIFNSLVKRDVDDSAPGRSRAQREALARAELIEKKMKENQAIMATLGYDAQNKGARKDDKGIRYTAEPALNDFTESLAKAIMADKPEINFEKAVVQAQELVFDAQKTAGTGKDQAILQVGDIEGSDGNYTRGYTINPNAGSDAKSNEALQKINMYVAANPDTFKASEDGRYRVDQNLKADGASNKRAGTAAQGATPSGGIRPQRFTEKDGQEAKEKADKNNWTLEPKS